MNEKETKQQLNKPSEAIEDLTVNEAEAEEVKGGPIHFFDVFLDDPPDVTKDARLNPYVTVDYVERTPK